MIRIIAAVVLSVLSNAVFAQETPNPSGDMKLADARSALPPVQLPDKILMRLYPRHLNGRAGRQLELSELKIEGTVVTGKATMFGKGADKCILRDEVVRGSLEGNQLQLNVVVKPGDNLTCPMNFRLTKGENGWSGETRNSQFLSQARQE